MNKLKRLDYQLNEIRQDLIKKHLSALLEKNKKYLNNLRLVCTDYPNKMIFYISNKESEGRGALNQMFTMMLSSKSNDFDELTVEYYAITNIDPREACVVQELIAKENEINIKTRIENISNYPKITDGLNHKVEGTLLDPSAELTNFIDILNKRIKEREEIRKRTEDKDNN